MIDIFDGHCKHLDSLARRLGASNVTKENATSLATGYRDLAVLLQEPGDQEDRLDHTELLPATVEFIANQLSDVDKMRGWQNTCLLEIRPFRSNAIRQTESKDMCEVKDNMAYCTTEEMVEQLKP